MEDYQIDIVLGQGPAARTLRLDLEPFTLVGRDDAHRTADHAAARPLRHHAAARVLRRGRADRQSCGARRDCWSCEIEDQAAVEIASRSRGTPRIANRLLRRVRDVAQVRHAGVLTLDVAQEALDLVDIDARRARPHRPHGARDDPHQVRRRPGRPLDALGRDRRGVRTRSRTCTSRSCCSAASSSARRAGASSPTAAALTSVPLATRWCAPASCSEAPCAVRFGHRPALLLMSDVR